jgi:RNA polymerase sigma-70 factor (ECF subfamily)
LPLSTSEPPRDRDDSEIVRLIPALRAFARTFYRDPVDADDLVQETLTKGVANIDKFKPGTRMKSWLFTIMRNTFCTRFATYKKEQPGLAECVSTHPSVEASQDWSVRSSEVKAAIERLPTPQREVIVLIGMLGVSYEETAEICGCAIGTVKSRLNRARATLLVQLGEASGETLTESSIQLSDGTSREERDSARSPGCRF